MTSFTVEARPRPLIARRSVQPDPASGMHCWHQKVTVEPAHAGDRYADVFVDTANSRAVYEEWKELTKPANGPLRRPLWMNRPLRPADEAYRLG